ncbi:MAG: hypothetical protein ACRCVT_12605 [Leadbetterella sp.]
MQLSLIDEVPEFTKNFFLDVFVESNTVGSKSVLRLRTISGQQVPQNMRVRMASKFLKKYPTGTIFKLDTKLVYPSDSRKPYFVALNGTKIQQALEFFDYNRKLQKQA